MIEQKVKLSTTISYKRILSVVADVVSTSLMLFVTILFNKFVRKISSDKPHLVDG